MYLPCSGGVPHLAAGSAGPRSSTAQAAHFIFERNPYMRKVLLAVLMFLLTSGLWAQSAPPATDDAAQLRQEIEQLKKTMNALEQRLDAQEKDAQQKAAQPAAPKVEAASTADLQT